MRSHETEKPDFNQHNSLCTLYKVVTETVIEGGERNADMTQRSIRKASREPPRRNQDSRD